MPQVVPVFSAIGAAAAGAGATIAAAAPVIAAGTGVAGTLYGVSQGNAQAKEAKNAASAQAEQTSKLAQEFYGQKATAESEAAAIAERDSARARQKALAVGAAGRRSTILTNPLGVVGEPSGQKKTALGV